MPDMRDFYIDPVKSGAVLRAFITKRNMSIAHIEEETGIDYDTLRNYLRGKIQKVTLDCLLKILAVTEHTLSDYFTALFATDEIHIYDAVIFDKPIAQAVTATDAPENSTDLLLPVSVPSEKSTAPTVAELEHYTQCLADAHERELQRTVNLYESQLRMLDQRYNSSVEHLKNDIEDLRRQLAQRESEVEGLNRLLGRMHSTHTPQRKSGTKKSHVTHAELL